MDQGISSTAKIMASFNNCTFSGNLGRDPEVKYFDDGKAVANFSIAVEGRKGQTLWMAVKVWNKPAQTIADYVRKGSRIIVNGELQEETWEKDGQQKSRMVLNCQNFTLLDGRKEAGNGNSGTSATKRAPKPQSRQQAADPIDEEIPF